MYRATLVPVFFCCIAIACPAVRADAPGLKTLAIGTAAPDFKLAGVDG